MISKEDYKRVNKKELALIFGCDVEAVRRNLLPNKHKASRPTVLGEKIREAAARIAAVYREVENF